MGASAGPAQIHVVNIYGFGTSERGEGGSRMELDRKFRVMADIVEQVSGGRTSIGDLWTTLAATGDVRKTEVESLSRLAVELGFLQSDREGRLAPSKAGRQFVRYMTATDRREMRQSMPPADRGTELKLCVTLPPRWKGGLRDVFGDRLTDTVTGERMVGEDARSSLVIISPFIDVGVLQLALANVLPGAVELTIITSEPSLARQFPGSKNYELEKLKNLVTSRFKSGVVYHLAEANSIAHAKVWCSEKSVLVTSANVKSDSASDNLEVGVFTDDVETVVAVNDFVRRLLRAGGMRCLLQTP